MKGILKNKLFKEARNLIYIDVGASGGLGGEWSNMIENIKVIGFEPDKEAYELLKKIKYDNKLYINSAVSSSKGSERL